jgi:capsular exopolysaccharide synthesis family protein
MSDTQSTLVTIADPRSPVSESFRTLRTNLQFASLDKPLRTILVTSPGAEEGKSTTLANLAVTMAQAEKRVILIDCDLRRPTLHKHFGLSNAAGLVTMMLEESAIQDPPLQETGVAGLWLLASGPLPPRPSDLLGSQRMGRIIQALLEKADVLLFDAPPVMAVTDASILATRVDGVLLVISAGHTKRDEMRTAKAQLEKVNAHIIGAVLTNAESSRGQNYYYGEAEGRQVQ